MLNSLRVLWATTGGGVLAVQKQIPCGGNPCFNEGYQLQQSFSASRATLFVEPRGYLHVKLLFFLLQVRPMAHMQLMVEKQMKKSPQVEVVCTLGRGMSAQ